jgi:hypothetical protein
LGRENVEAVIEVERGEGGDWAEVLERARLED